jgi:antitoxin (DNA-binding transcriptional repressor) of toxin-antitoxin stability system
VGVVVTLPAGRDKGHGGVPRGLRLDSAWDSIARGEEIIIASAGIPVPRLVPIALPRAPLQPGSARGLGQMGDEFDAPMPEDFLRHFG